MRPWVATASVSGVATQSGMQELKIERYVDQLTRWPGCGRHILAQFDDDSIVVYQAYPADIGAFAVQHGRFGGEFSYARMSWIKPNFLWMMYRSGWGTKAGQHVTLALRIRRGFFDGLLTAAVESTYSATSYASREAWQEAVASSSVRLQWDPDHDPLGEPVERRAIQLGLRGHVLETFGKRELLNVIDVSEFVSAQRVNANSERLRQLWTPTEEVYLPCEAARNRIGL
jgi:hypothetical protein